MSFTVACICIVGNMEIMYVFFMVLKNEGEILMEIVR